MAKNDELIKQLMAKVAEQKTALGTKPKVSWKTNGVYKFDGRDYFNINTVSNPEQLVMALAHMLNNHKSCQEAAERLGVDIQESVYSGYKISEWEEDFKLRISILKWEEKKKNLEETEKKLAGLVSEEARTEMELEKISKSLGL
jgi:hypothetical protein